MTRQQHFRKSSFQKFKPIKLVILIASIVLINLEPFLATLDAYISGATAEGLGLYATARGINAIISVLQTVEASIFVSTIGIGEALDPLNDAVERFSTVLSWSIGALFAQNFGFELLKIREIGVIISVLGAVSIALGYLAKVRAFEILNTAAMSEFLWRAFLVLIYVRLTLPIAIAASMWMNEALIQQKLDTHSDNLQKYEATMEAFKGEFQNETSIDPERIDEREAELSSATKELADAQSALDRSIEDLESYQENQAAFRCHSWMPLCEGDETEIQLQEQISANTDTVEEIERKIEPLQQELECQNLASEGKDCRGFLERIKGVDMSVLVDSSILKDLTVVVSEASVTLLMLISAIALKTVVMPLLTVWVILKAMKPIIRGIMIGIGPVISAKSDEPRGIAKNKSDTSA